jgi:hypothetical protein
LVLIDISIGQFGYFRPFFSKTVNFCTGATKKPILPHVQKLMVSDKKLTKKIILTVGDIYKGPKWNLFSLRDQSKTKKIFKGPTYFVFETYTN